MQIGIDVTCMCTNFGGRDFSGFGDNANLINVTNFPFLVPGATKKFTRLESAHEIHASRH